jgi:hypothetical protein
MPDSVTSLGLEAFAGRLLSGGISLSHGLQKLGDRAFAVLSAKTSSSSSVTEVKDGVELPASLTECGQNVFGGRNRSVLSLPGELLTVEMGASVDILRAANGAKEPQHAVDWATYPVERLELPSSLETLAEGEFKKCSAVAGCFARDCLVQSLPAEAFAGGNLQKVELPLGLTAIGQKAFRHARIRAVTVPAAVTVISDEAFAKSDLTFVTFEKGSQLSEIGARAFCGT